MTIPIATPNQEVRPWTRADIASAFLTLAILYALSPPWMIAVTRVWQSPPWAADFVAFIYHPLSLARQNSASIDQFYESYRLLVAPLLTGI